MIKFKRKAIMDELKRKARSLEDHNGAGEVRRNAVTSTGLLADESKGAGQ